MQKNSLRLLALFISIWIIYQLSFDHLNQSQLEVNPPSISEPVTIRFMSSWGGNDNKTAIVNRLIQNFNQTHPDIIVINESMSGEDFLFNLKTDFASNNPPDVFGLWPGSDLDLLIKKGMVADLKPMFTEDVAFEKRFKPQILQTYFSDEEIYSIPFEIIYEGLFLNKSLFDRFKLEIPTNYDELIQAVRVFKSVNVIPIAYNVSPEGSFIYQNLVASMGGKAIESNRVYLRETMIKAADHMVELYELGAFPRDAFLIDDASRNQMFKKGKSAMIVQGSWYIDEDLGSDFKVIFIPFPFDEDRQVLTYGIGNGNFHISKNCQDSDEKWTASIEFLKYFTSESSLAEFENLPGFESSLIYGKVVSQPNIELRLKAVEEFVKPIDHLIDRASWESEIIYNFPQLLERKITPEALIPSDY